MFDHTPTPPPKPQSSSTLVVSAFDVQWGKPIFRAPDLPARVNLPAEIPFSPLRVTESRKQK